MYGISVAAELSGIDPQTLRLYERRGLLTPARSDGGTRRYSDDDLDRLARISDLVAQGINIAGIAQILHLQHRNTELESDNSDLKSENARLRSDKPTKAVVALGCDVDSVRSGRSGNFRACGDTPEREPGSRRWLHHVLITIFDSSHRH